MKKEQRQEPYEVRAKIPELYEDFLNRRKFEIRLLIGRDLAKDICNRDTLLEAYKNGRYIPDEDQIEYFASGEAEKSLQKIKLFIFLLINDDDFYQRKREERRKRPGERLRLEGETIATIENACASKDMPHIKEN